MLALADDAAIARGTAKAASGDLVTGLRVTVWATARKGGSLVATRVRIEDARLHRVGGVAAHGERRDDRLELGERVADRSLADLGVRGSAARARRARGRRPTACRWPALRRTVMPTCSSRCSKCASPVDARSSRRSWSRKSASSPVRSATRCARAVGAGLARGQLDLDRPASWRRCPRSPTDTRSGRRAARAGSAHRAARARRPSTRRQLPTKRAARFSVKAVRPSRASSVENRIANRSASCTRFAPRSPCSERFVASFA